MKLLRRRETEEVGTLATDLQERLAVYTSAGQVRCKGCGTWVSQEEAQAQRWGYHRLHATGRTFPYCAECAEREFGAPP
jgi:formamidopyrimidine-DNA glycosylase